MNHIFVVSQHSTKEEGEGDKRKEETKEENGQREERKGEERRERERNMDKEGREKEMKGRRKWRTSKREMFESDTSGL